MITILLRRPRHNAMAKPIARPQLRGVDFRRIFDGLHDLLNRHHNCGNLALPAPEVKP